MKKIFTSVFILVFLLMNSQNIVFPDPVFKAVLVGAGPNVSTAKDLNGNFFKIDSNNDGEISLSEASLVGYLNIELGGVSSVEGIRNFTNVSSLNIYSNDITTVDLHQMPMLKYYNHVGNVLQTVNLQGNTGLLELKIEDSFNLDTVDLSTCTALEKVRFYNTTLTSLNVSNHSALKEIDCAMNDLLASAQVLGCNNLEYVQISGSVLTTIDLTGLHSLTWVDLHNNYFTTLNFEDQNQLDYLNIWGNTDLTSLYIKNGAIETMNFSVTPNLQYICCDSIQISTIQNTIVSNPSSGYNSSCIVNSTCNDVLSVAENQSVTNNVIIYPNPVVDVFDISTQNKIQSVEIFDTAGRLVFSISNPSKSINIHHLKSGQYLAVIKSDNKKTSKKIIKK